MVRNNGIFWQMCNYNHELSWKYVANQVSLASVNCVWPRIRIYWLWVHKKLNWKKCWIIAKPISLVNTTSNAILERIHSVLGKSVWRYNIKYTYLYNYDPWLGILAAAEFIIHSTANRLKGYTPGQLIFGCDMILQIKHEVYW